jgi:hypothetical protein
MQKALRAAAAAGVVGTLGVGISLAGAGSAQASGLSGWAYDGKDPVATGCSSSAYTVTSAPINRHIGNLNQTSNTGIVLELRYSPVCGTNWARLLFTGWQAGWVGVEVDAVRDSVRPVSEPYSYSGRTLTIWGNMVYAPNGVCAHAWAEVDGWSYTFVGSTRSAC